MGWLFFSKPSGLSTREILEREALRWSGLPAEEQPKVVGYTCDGSFHAFAVRFPKACADYTPEADGSTTVAICFLTSSRGGEFGYKDMDETMGPCETIKSQAFLDLLSETTIEHALDWRRRCRKAIEAERATRAKKKVMGPGARIKLAEPLTFNNGMVLDEFTVVSVPRRGRVQTLYQSKGGGYYRIPSSALATATVL